jgi:hypothetical protein
MSSVNFAIPDFCSLISEPWSRKVPPSRGQRGRAGEGVCERQGSQRISRELTRINTNQKPLASDGTQQKCPHNPNEISSLHPELVLRHIPGKLLITAGASAAVPARGPRSRVSAYVGLQNNRGSACAISPGSAGAGPLGTPLFRKHVVVVLREHPDGTTGDRWCKVVSRRQAW